MNIDYLASPIKDVVYFIGVCDSLNSPTLIRGKILRVEASVHPTSNIPSTTTDTLEVRYVILSDDKKNVVLENPTVFDPMNPGRADMFVASYDQSAAQFQINNDDARQAAISELGLRTDEKFA